ncbi:unnamed protein product [Phytomonas sp. Hart1]|nr:unnamed protein product [Phytomonas sp. Hart1]|eukprot:CCW67725.1 unnamed protein product [Phytomonas sp. isolate Hart1]
MHKLNQEAEGEVTRCIANNSAVVFAGRDGIPTKIQTLQREINMLQKKQNHLVAAVATQQYPLPQHAPLNKGADNNEVCKVLQHGKAGMGASSSPTVVVVKKEGVSYANKKHVSFASNGQRATKEVSPRSVLQNFRPEGRLTTTVHENLKHQVALDLSTSLPQASEAQTTTNDSVFMTEVYT